jgi:glycosyltransferase involved in cell wall biosynthesis
MTPLPMVSSPLAKKRIGPERPRVAVLWTGLSGYLVACLRELVNRDVDLLVVFEEPTNDAPFQLDLEIGAAMFPWSGQPAFPQIEQRLERFKPHILVIAGWHVRVYRQVASRWQGRSLRVLCTDNPWTGSLRQQIAAVIAPLFIHRLCEYMWVPGERQAVLARRFGFSCNRIIRGMYSCDWRAFSGVGSARRSAARPRSRRFLFVGRLVPDKGVDTLVAAYRLYRIWSSDPWGLEVRGDGPLSASLLAQPGIDYKGFTQPAALPSVFADSDCLVLPSMDEHWGVIVQEAATAGLAIIASDQVGCTPHLVQDGFNGFVFEAGDEAALATLLTRYSNQSEEALDEMSAASMSLASQYTPSRWAAKILDLLSTPTPYVEGPGP